MLIFMNNHLIKLEKYFPIKFLIFIRTYSRLKFFEGKKLVKKGLENNFGFSLVD